MNDKGFLLFIFFIVVFFVLLTGGSIVRYLKKAKLKAKKNADAKAQKFRDEIGRQQRQYHYTAKSTPNQQAEPRSAQEESLNRKRKNLLRFTPRRLRVRLLSTAVQSVRTRKSTRTLRENTLSLVRNDQLT